MPDDVAPRMSNNEALRRLLAIYTNPDGSLKPGAPGGPQPGQTLSTIRHEATGPAPELAYLLVGPEANRVGGMLRNLDEEDTIWYGSSADITDESGGTLGPGESIPINTAGPLYVYKTTGNPIAEFAGLYA